MSKMFEEEKDLVSTVLARDMKERHMTCEEYESLMRVRVNDETYYNTKIFDLFKDVVFESENLVDIS